MSSVLSKVSAASWATIPVELTCESPLGAPLFAFFCDAASFSVFRKSAKTCLVHGQGGPGHAVEVASAASKATGLEK